MSPVRFHTRTFVICSTSYSLSTLFPVCSSSVRYQIKTKMPKINKYIKHLQPPHSFQGCYHRQLHQKMQGCPSEKSQCWPITYVSRHSGSLLCDVNSLFLLFSSQSSLREFKLLCSVLEANMLSKLVDPFLSLDFVDMCVACVFSSTVFRHSFLVWTVFTTFIYKKLAESHIIYCFVFKRIIQKELFIHLHEL